jgi:hypothetical protein
MNGTTSMPGEGSTCIGRKVCATLRLHNQVTDCTRR